MSGLIARSHNFMNAEKLNGTTGSLMKLLEKEKSNPNYRADLRAVVDFINDNTGFKFSYGNSDEQTMTIRAFAK